MEGGGGGKEGRRGRDGGRIGEGRYVEVVKREESHSFIGLQHKHEWTDPPCCIVNLSTLCNQGRITTWTRPSCAAVLVTRKEQGL